jgi:hypothetical protein
MRKHPIHPSSKQKQRREEKLRREAEQATARRVQRLKTSGIIAAGVLLVVGLVAFIVLQNARPVNAAYQPTDAISCDGGEHSDFHIHAHLSIYINGQAAPVPATIGIAPDQSCIYWLHTHSGDGVIHIEAPKDAALKLGNFFDIWRASFPQLGYPSELNQKVGWTAYVNGKPFSGDFHAIPLQAHTLITLAYNSPGVQPDTSFNWNGL